MCATIAPAPALAALSRGQLALLGLKRCSREGCPCPIHPIEDFARDRRRSDGRQAWCKPCKHARQQVTDAARQRTRGAELNAKREARRSAAQESGRKRRRNGRLAAAPRRDAIISPKDERRLATAPCFYCGGPTEGASADHVIAVAQSGPEGIGNRVACCRSCNSEKGDKLVSDWIRYRVRVGHPVPAAGILGARQPLWARHLR